MLLRLPNGDVIDAHDVAAVAAVAPAVEIQLTDGTIKIMGSDHPEYDRDRIIQGIVNIHEPVFDLTEPDESEVRLTRSDQVLRIPGPEENKTAVSQDVPLGTFNASQTSWFSPQSPGAATPEMTTGFVLNGQVGTVLSQVFRGAVGTPVAGLYAYLVKIVAGNVATASYTFGGTPSPATINGQKVYGVQEMEGGPPIHSLTWKPGTNAYNSQVSLGLGPGPSPAVLIFSAQAPQYQGMVALSDGQGHGAYSALVYVPYGGAFGPLA